MSETEFNNTYANAYLITICSYNENCNEKWKLAGLNLSLNRTKWNHLERPEKMCVARNMV